MFTYLPVFGVSLQHHWVFGLTDLAIIGVLDLLDFRHGLDTVVLRERTTVALTASVGEEVRSIRLNLAHHWLRQGAKGFEVRVVIAVTLPLCGEERDGFAFGRHVLYVFFSFAFSFLLCFVIGNDFFELADLFTACYLLEAILCFAVGKN